MKKSLMLLVALTMGATAIRAQPPGDAGAPPPMPSYQMRAALPDSDRLNTDVSGETLYSNHCGYCHLPYGMGTTVLMIRRMPTGAAPHTALLTNRDDLTVEYVKAVVRMGKGAMPRQTRVDITDSELDQVAAYLTGAEQ